MNTAKIIMGMFLLVACLVPSAFASWDWVHAGSYNVSFYVNITEYDISDPEYANLEDGGLWAFNITSRNRPIANVKIHRYDRSLYLKKSLLREELIDAYDLNPILYGSVTYYYWSIGNQMGILAVVNALDGSIYYFSVFSPDKSSRGYGHSVVMTACYAPWLVSGTFLHTLKVEKT